MPPVTDMAEVVAFRTRVLELVKYHGWQNDGRWQTPAMKNLYHAIAALKARNTRTQEVGE